MYQFLKLEIAAKKKEKKMLVFLPKLVPLSFDLLLNISYLNLKYHAMRTRSFVHLHGYG